MDFDGTLVSEGQTYALVRPDGETFLLEIGELGQNANGSKWWLDLSMFPAGKFPWGMQFYVVDTQGRPVAGATATLSITERLQKVEGVATYQTQPTRTFYGDAQGCIRMPPLPRGATFHGEVAAPGFFTRVSIRGTRDNDGRYDPPGVQGKVQLKRPGAIEGQVLGLDGKPLAHAPLSLDTTVEYPGFVQTTGNQLRAISDDQGRFRIEGVPPGTQRLYYPWSGPSQGEIDSGRWRAFEIKKDGIPAVPLPLAGCALVKQVTVDEAKTTRDVVLDFSQSTSTIEGKVLDAAGKPVSGASVIVMWLQDDGKSHTSFGFPGVVTDLAGHYRVDHLPSGTFQLYAIPYGMTAVPEKARAAAPIILAARQVLHHDLRDASCGKTRCKAQAVRQVALIHGRMRLWSRAEGPDVRPVKGEALETSGSAYP